MALLCLMAGAGVSVTQELELRAYANTPVGVNFIGIGYGYSSGKVFFNSALPLEDSDGRINALFVRYVRSLSLFGKPAKIKATLPWTNGHWEGVVEDEFVSRTATGLADARLGIDILLSGAPPLKPAEIAEFQQRTIVGFSLDLIVPVGDYDPTKLVNIGSNRWVINPEVAVSQNLGGKWTLEVVGSVWIYTDNDDFLNGMTLEQDVFVAFKTHIIRTIRPGLWWGVGVGYGEGGTTSVNGSIRQTTQQNWRFGVFLSVPIAKNQGFLFSALSGVTQRVGADFDSAAIAYQFSWGGQ